MKKNLKKALFGVATLVATVALSVGITASVTTTEVSADEVYTVQTGSLFEDALNNGRVDVDLTQDSHTITLEVSDGQPSSTRAVYAQAIDLTNAFEMTFTVNQLCTDGAFRISFLSSKADYPMEQYGDGFSIYFWDETAWGYPEGTSLRADLYTWSKNPAQKQNVCNDAFRKKAYANQPITLKVWNYSESELAYSITKDGDKVEHGFAKSYLPSGFDYTNCYMMLTPEIDGSRPHSYANDVKLTFDIAPNLNEDTNNMLEVKAQTNAAQDAIRFVSSVDSLDYVKAGFEISVDVDGTTKTVTVETTRVYTSLLANGTKFYSTEFGVADGYLFAYTVTGVPSADTQFTVRAYVVTNDGETIYGAANVLKISDANA